MSAGSDGPPDWNLPNAELARIWGVTADMIRRRRKAAGNPAPRWTLRGGGWMREHAAYQAALAAEEARAARAKAGE